MGNNVNYARTSDKLFVPDAEVSADQNKQDSENLNQIYQGIR